MTNIGPRTKGLRTLAVGFAGLGLLVFASGGATGLLRAASSQGAGSKPALDASGSLATRPAPATQAPPVLPPVTVLVVYYSVTGNTEKMARAVAEGVRQVRGAGAVLKRPAEVTAADLRGADGIVLGSPTYWANMAAPMKAFIDDWFLKFKVPLIDKVGGSFSSGGTETGGKEAVLYSLDLAMTNAGLIVVGPIVDGFGQAGVSALDPVGEKALRECRLLGERVAGVARRLAATAAGTEELKKAPAR